MDILRHGHTETLASLEPYFLPEHFSSFFSLGLRTGRSSASRVLPKPPAFTFTFPLGTSSSLSLQTTSTRKPSLMLPGDVSFAPYILSAPHHGSTSPTNCATGTSQQAGLGQHTSALWPVPQRLCVE